jgi:TPR repeat protein
MLLEAVMGAYRTMPTALFVAVCLAMTGYAPSGAFADTSLAGQIGGLVRQKDDRGLVKIAKKLRSGTSVSKDNPLKVADFAGARQTLEAAIALAPALAIEAKLLLAKMLLDGEGGSIEIDRALNLLHDAAKAGNATAAYLQGQQLLLYQDRQEQARESLSLALRLGHAPAAFALAAIQGTDRKSAEAMNDFAVSLLKQRAERGEADAAFELGAHFRKLPAKAEDQVAALNWYRKAADMGSEGAAVWVASLLGNPALSTFDRAAALVQYQAAANAGSLSAAQEIVRDFTDAGPLQVPAPVYQHWLGKLLDADDATAVLYSARSVDDTPEQRQTASDRLYTSALAGEIGPLDDLIRIGESFRDGAGVVTSRERAFEVFRLATERGSNAALSRLARLLVNAPSLRSQANVGFVVTKLETVSAKGNATADLLLGDIYARGVTGQTDNERAIALYRKALTITDSAEVLDRLADIYLASQDAGMRKRAFPYIQRASRAGSDSAMLKEAQAYADGEIVGRDFNKAVRIYEQAAAAGATDATVKLADLYMSTGKQDAFANARKTFTDAIAAGNRETSVELARFLRANGKLVDAIDCLTAAARQGSSSAAIELYNYVSERAQSPNVGTEWLDLALTDVGNIPRDKLHLASAMLMPADIRLNLRGVSLLRELTAADVPGAAVALADAYIKGRGGIKDPSIGMDLLLQAAGKGDVDALLLLGDVYMDGTDVAGDSAKAAGFYQAAVTLDPDNQSANARLARAYRDGKGVPRDLGLAASHLKAAADAGSRMATRDLGLAYLHGSGVEQNADKAVQLLHASAERGFAYAWSDLSDAYGSAIGPPVDPSQSFRFSMRGARSGDPSAMIATGVALLSGFGTQRDGPAGMAWLKRASATDGPEALEAMYRLAEVYRYGAGVKKDSDAARDWLLKAAKGGNASAMFRTALDLQADDPQSGKAEAIRWLRNAQALGHVQSIKKLNKMGLGTEGSSTAPATKVEDDGVEE